LPYTNWAVEQSTPPQCEVQTTHFKKRPGRLFLTRGKFQDLWSFSPTVWSFANDLNFQNGVP
jgi:hypothetical protein